MRFNCLFDVDGDIVLLCYRIEDWMILIYEAKRTEIKENNAAVCLSPAVKMKIDL